MLTVFDDMYKKKKSVFIWLRGSLFWSAFLLISSACSSANQCERSIEIQEFCAKALERDVETQSAGHATQHCEETLKKSNSKEKKAFESYVDCLELISCENTSATDSTTQNRERILREYLRCRSVFLEQE